MARLAAPFPADVIAWRPGSLTKTKDKAQALAYIDARDVQNRLDEVLGFDWEMRHYAVGNDHVCCEITLTLPTGKKVTRTNGCWVGNVDVVTTKDGKVDSKEEDRADREAKWALSDAFKRAAVMFGVGKYLYDMPNPYMPINEYQKFSDETLAYLKKLAHKPFEEWQRAREARSKNQQGQGQGSNGAGNGAPPPRKDPPRDQPRSTSASSGGPPPAQAPQQGPPAAAPPPQQAAPPPAQNGAPAQNGGPVTDGGSFIDRLINEADTLKNEGEFHRYVGRTRDTFAEGTPERTRYAAAVRAAADRLGVKPKGQSQGSGQQQQVRR